MDVLPRRFLNGVRTAWGIFGGGLVLLLALEAVGRFAILPLLPPPPDPGPRFDPRAYGNAPWLEDYAREFRDSRQMRWRPYVEWRRRPFRGRYINVSEDGMRRTWEPGAAPDASPEGRPLRIFMFGGSTLWGSGARDESTIPSLLARRLASSGRRAAITNFGESGYVSTQEVLALLLELQRRNVPDLVIFYDGFNDVYSVMQGQAAGTPLNDDNREREFNLLNPARRRDLYSASIRTLLYESSLSQVARALVRAVRPAPRAIPVVPPGPAEDVLRVYSQNRRLVGELGKAFGFDALFYWQPVIFATESLTPYERTLAVEQEHLRAGFLAAYPRVAADASLAGDDRFHDISRVLDAQRQTGFIDACHLTEEGNEVVAKRIAEDVLALAAPPRGGGAPDPATASTARVPRSRRW